jgi:heat shock protein HslJ
VGFSCENKDTEPENELEGAKYKLFEFVGKNYLPLSDNTFTVQFGTNTLEGRTVGNSFTANYEIIDNRINISNFAATNLIEKDLISADFLALLSNSFDFQIEDNQLIISNDSQQMILKNEMPATEPLFEYYYRDSIFFVLDTLQLFLETTEKINTKSEFHTFLQNFNIDIDTAFTHIAFTGGYVRFASPMTKNDYKKLLQSLNASSDVLYATPCFIPDWHNNPPIFWAITNVIGIVTASDEMQMRQILTTLNFPAYSFPEQGGSGWALALDNIETGFEPFDWANILHNLSDIESAQPSFIRITQSNNNY